ncbi:MAG: hypothetical protein MJZ26_12145 [Fibrobacter sp.]|nr:hypothetical protein [Fibrobacter sp.]
MVKEGDVIFMKTITDLEKKQKPIKFVIEKIYPIKRAFGVKDYFALARSVSGKYPVCFSKLDLAENGYDEKFPEWNLPKDGYGTGGKDKSEYSKRH